jgi:hypothetical protein
VSMFMSMSRTHLAADRTALGQASGLVVCATASSRRTSWGGSSLSDRSTTAAGKQPRFHVRSNLEAFIHSMVKLTGLR